MQKGKPVAKTVKTREQCLSSGDMQNISRAPLVAMLFWKCHQVPVEVSFEANNFGMVMACPPTNKDKPVMGISEVSLTPDQKSIFGTQVKIEIDTKKGDKQKTIYSKGTSLTYLAPCGPDTQNKP